MSTIRIPITHTAHDLDTAEVVITAARAEAAQCKELAERLMLIEEVHPDGECAAGHPLVRFWTQHDDGPARTCPLCAARADATQWEKQFYATFKACSERIKERDAARAEADRLAGLLQKRLSHHRMASTNPAPVNQTETALAARDAGKDKP